MKHLILIILLFGVVLTVGAQKNQKMSKEEKEKILKELKVFYELETGQHFNFKFEESVPSTIYMLPWQRWGEAYKNSEMKFTRVVKGFERMQLEPVEDNPNSCLLALRWPLEDRLSFIQTSSSSFRMKFRTDGAGNRIGFWWKDSGFCDFGVSVDFHLTDRSGNPVFILPEEKVYYVNKENGSESSIALKFPLIIPFSEVADGYIDVRFDSPEQYEWLTLTKKDIGQDQTLCGVPFRLEKIADKGFIISASQDDSERLAGLEYFYSYQEGSIGSILEPSSSSSYSGNLSGMMVSQNSNNLTFEKWLEEKGVDLKNLEGTIGNLNRKDKNSRWGKYFESGMTGDAILLYMPVDSATVKPLVTARIFVPKSGKPAEISIDQEQVAMLHEQMLHPKAKSESSIVSEASQQEVTLTEETPAILIAVSTSDQPKSEDGEVAPPAGPQLDQLIRRAKAKLSKSEMIGVPPSLGFSDLTNAELDALLADNDQISYAAGVWAAQALWENLQVREVIERNKEESYPILYEWFGKGLNAYRKIYLDAEAALENEWMEVYCKENKQDSILKAIGHEIAVAKNAGELNAWSFEMGTNAFMQYRSMAAHDYAMLTLPTGKRMDMEAAEKGFRDYFERTLTQGLQYSLVSLPQRRKVKALNCNDDLEASVGLDENGSMLNGFKPAEGWNQQIQQTENIMLSLRRELLVPKQALENGISGKVLLEVVAEEDGAISQVIVKRSPSDILSCAAVDAVYRLYLRPAMVGGTTPVAFRMSLPIIFAGW